MSHPTEPLSMVKGHTGPQALILLDDEGNAISVTSATGSDLEFIVRASAIEGETDIIRLEESSGIEHGGETGLIKITISDWDDLPVGQYAAEVKVVLSSVIYWSFPFTFNVLPNFV